MSHSSVTYLFAYLMRLPLSMLALLAFAVIGCDSNDDDGPRTFTITIANPSDAPSANGAPNVLSPGAWAVHSDAVDFYAPGGSASEGIERIAEDGDPSVYAAALAGVSGVRSSGAFDTAAGASAPGPIMPGGSYTFIVTASPGDRFSMATMWVQSNDGFLAFAPEGIALFNGNDPVSGDVTNRVQPIWDAGTEVNEQPGTGVNQAPRQSGPDAGTPENDVIRPIGSVGDGYAYPDEEDVIRVTITVQ